MPELHPGPSVWQVQTETVTEGLQYLGVAVEVCRTAESAHYHWSATPPGIGGCNGVEPTREAARARAMRVAEALTCQVEPKDATGRGGVGVIVDRSIEAIRVAMGLEPAPQPVDEPEVSVETTYRVWADCSRGLFETALAMVELSDDEVGLEQCHEGYIAEFADREDADQVVALLRTLKSAT